MPKKSRRKGKKATQAEDGERRRRQQNNNNEAVGEEDGLDTILQLETRMRNMRLQLISSLGDGYDDESLKKLDEKMRDYYLSEDDFYYDEEWCKNVKNSNPEKPTEEEMERYKNSTIIRRRCLRNANGHEQLCNFLGGEACKNIDLYQALYDDLVSYHYIWFEIIFKDGTTDLHSACATMIKFASVKLEMGVTDIEEMKKIMLLLDELKNLFQATVRDGDIEACEDAGTIEYDFYELCYKFSIELTKANEDDNAEYYFEKAFSAENMWGYYEDMHCGKLLEFATGRDFSEEQLWKVDDYALFNDKLFYCKCLKAYVNNQRGSVPMPAFDDLNKSHEDEAEDEDYCNNCRMPSRLLEKMTGKKLLRCTRCKIALYCNKECQKADWKRGHKKECKST